MFNKKLSLAVFLGLFLTSCLHKKQTVKKTEKDQSKTSEFVQEGGTYVFAEEAGEFRLDDELDDLFEGKQGDLSDKDDFQWDNIAYDTDAGEVIQFDFDDTAIKASEKAKIKHNAELAKQELEAHPKSKVAVKGHSCKIAKSELYNRAISQERAEHVAQEYTKNGVDRDKVNAIGYGASELLTDEDGMLAQAPNRRVETDFVLD
jgi:OOP family OmpA-OmpF porin